MFSYFNMKKQMKDLYLVWKNVFGNWRYISLMFFILLLFYSFNVFIANFDSLISFYNTSGFIGTLKLFSAFFIGFIKTRPLSSIISLILVSILFGILFSLITYKTKMIKSVSGKTGVFATTGIFLGILAPGCVSCGVGLLSLFGISAAALTLLPFDGLELSILAILILGFSSFKITKDINKGIVCKIDERE